ncbi:two-component system sensor histidine kinase NtrB [Desulforhabdus amnigena]|uniref:histidine kinase n=1 Tax=Desulforhabdus amnigena TaxID=40218 RepID=A0A9W6CW61_9BACT|nr:ATP-binding protein [Desulforhabdus amnigena]GLI33659.1 sensor histidine kinase [Desulforhabdus amnigena]
MSEKPTLDDLIGIEYAKLGFFREVQEKVAELQASNLKLELKRRHIQGILDGITDVMAILTLDFRITSVNHVYYDIFKETQPVGKYCFEVFRQQKERCSSCPVVIALDTNRVCRQLDIFSVGGKNRHFEITASPLRNSEGNPCHILLLKRDVTLEKEYQAKYYQAQQMATVGALAAGVAHEINNPLTAISGFAEGLKRRLPKLKEQVDKDLAEDFDEYINIILKECRRCQGIVQNLLDFGRPKSNDFRSVNLNMVVRDTLKLLQNHLKYYPEGHVRQELQEPLPFIQADASQLKQVVLNLLFNALDATQGRGTVILRTFSTNDQWVGLAVEDNGCGIPSENLDKLFEPFFTTKPAGKGIGIGLSTCYNIIQNHGGEILVCSEVEKGSTFLVRLPTEPSTPLVLVV